MRSRAIYILISITSIILLSITYLAFAGWVLKLLLGVGPYDGVNGLLIIMILALFLPCIAAAVFSSYALVSYFSRKTSYPLAKAKKDFALAVILSPVVYFPLALFFDAVF